MSTAATASRPVSTAAGPASRGYRTLWRWHFYAGLFVMPFLVVLALTGTLYCFQQQIEPLLYPHRLVVSPRAEPRLTEDALLAKARSALPEGSVATTARLSSRADRSAEFIFRLPDGDKQSIYLNPYDGTVLGTLSVERRFMQVDRMIHRKLLLGKPGELLMELVACWTLVMIGTGVALWWPRVGTTWRAALLPCLTLRGRPLWKSVHAALGIWLAVGALAFVVTGLPWTGSWGKQFKSLATSVGLGSPPGSWGGSPLHSRLPVKHDNQGAGTSANPAGRPQGQAPHTSHPSRDNDMEAMPGMTMDDLPLPQVPWAVGAARVPQSPGAGPASWTLDNVIAQMRALGLADGYDIALPASASGVYTVSYFPADPKLERTLYIDQYSGAILKDIRYGDYGAVAKAVSYGTSLHMGRYFGLANQLVCSVLSLGLAALAVTGCVMWWKRRPAGALGAPARENAVVPMRGWKLGLIVLGAVFPLMGTTLVLVWLVDRMLFARSASLPTH
jgi:uncharacterized iron-regulated membrane protein